MLSVLYADKNYRSIGAVLCNGTDLVKANFIPPYPDSDLLSNAYNVEINSLTDLQYYWGKGNGERQPIIRLE